MNETELGFLGSIVYLGIVIVGTLAGHLYLRFNSKLLTLIALVLLEGTLGLFVLSDQKWTAYVSRFLIGAFQVFLLVYYPVWIDKFGQDKKTLWLTLLQICVPVGIFAGYGMTAAVLSLGQTYLVSFYLQIGIVAIFIVGFAFVPKDKLDCRREDDHHE
jgi:predicted MFS family arabinose efflux permease